MPRYKACRTCHALINGNRCPNCGKTDLTDNWSGIIAVISIEDSETAKQLNIKFPGCYAIHVR